MSQGTLALQSTRVIEQLESLVHHYGSQLEANDPMARNRIEDCMQTLQDLLVDATFASHASQARHRRYRRPERTGSMRRPSIRRSARAD